MDIENGEGVHWPLIAEQALHGSGRRDERIYNAAMSAYSSAHSLVRFTFDLVQYEPDMILVKDNINDLSVNYYVWYAGQAMDANYRVKYGRKDATGIITEQDIVLLRVWHSVQERLRDLVRRAPQPAHPEYQLEPGRSFFKRNLSNLIALAGAKRVAVVLLTMPMCDSESVFEQTRRGGRDAQFFPVFPGSRAGTTRPFVKWEPSSTCP